MYLPEQVLSVLEGTQVALLHLWLTHRGDDIHEEAVEVHFIQVTHGHVEGDKSISILTA
jgi:hypothetical protein